MSQTLAAMAGSDPRVVEFAEAFDAGAYFEAHEILEGYWVEYRGEDRTFYQGLIQAAVALHHLRRGNPVGARGVARSCARRLGAWTPSHAGLDVAGFLAALDAAIDGRGDAPHVSPWPRST